MGLHWTTKIVRAVLIYRRATLKGGIGGGLAGLALGAVGVYAAGARYPAFRQLTVPLRAFLMTSAGTFSGMEYSPSFGPLNFEH